MYLHHFTENHSSDPNSPIFKKLNKSYKEFNIYHKNLQSASFMSN